jgi:hypothetical protein
MLVEAIAVGSLVSSEINSKVTVEGMYRRALYHNR